MEPIVSPWLIYLVERLDGLQAVFGIIAVLIGFVFVVLSAVLTIAALENDMEKECKSVRHCLKMLVIPLIFFTATAIAIPDTNTGYKMLVASKLTPDNLQKLQEKGVELKDVFKDDTKEVIESLHNSVDKEATE